LEDIDEPESLIGQLQAIVSDMRAMERGVDLERFGPRKESARNHLALRRHDVRDLQGRLELLGLSSLGRSEGHVLFNIEAVLRVLGRLAGRSGDEGDLDREVSPPGGRNILKRNADELLGPVREGRQVRIMVTMPCEAATDYTLVRDLVVSGMDIMRINCAHDREAEWARMVRNLRLAEKETGRSCRVLMDIAGPKIRTGELAPGPRVLKWRPKRDSFGRVVAPARVWLTSRERPERPPQAPSAVLRCDTRWLARLVKGGSVRFEDARGARRSIKLVRKSGESWWGESRKTSYVTPETKFIAGEAGPGAATTVAGISSLEEPILLMVGDTLVLKGTGEAGRPAARDRSGSVVRPATISCTLPEVLAQVRKGEHVWFDDGKVAGVVTGSSSKQVELKITAGASEGTKLGADKGINLPDTDIRLPALTPKDVADLEFIAKHADMVGYSFVRNPGDIDVLRKRLHRLTRRNVGIVLKIETRRAFEQLPNLLLAAMREGDSGVMIARGDLAVECGYERLAEVQEEILWLCEAAHMPAIWATQVLEGLAKSGFPSRAEVTDAAMGERAECVMLNKGPHIAEAVRALDSILRRMQEHQLKKSAMLRHLNIADAFVNEPSGWRGNLRRPL